MVKSRYADSYVHAYMIAHQMYDFFIFKHDLEFYLDGYQV